MNFVFIARETQLLHVHNAQQTFTKSYDEWLCLFLLPTIRVAKAQIMNLFQCYDGAFLLWDNLETQLCWAR